MHLPIVGVTSVIGFFGGGLTGAFLSIAPMRALPAELQSIGWVPLIVVPPLFFGGAILGLRMLPRLISASSRSTARTATDGRITVFRGSRSRIGAGPAGTCSLRRCIPSDGRAGKQAVGKQRLRLRSWRKRDRGLYVKQSLDRIGRPGSDQQHWRCCS